MKKYIYSILIFLVFLESFLRLFHIFQDPSEKVLGYYNYKYNIKKDSWYHTWKKNSIIDFKQAEFHYSNKYNDLGHREINFSDYKKKSKQIKVLCIGDSFTEGDGAPYDSTWVRQLEKKNK